jgi:hypothetical protein
MTWWGHQSDVIKAAIVGAVITGIFGMVAAAIALSGTSSSAPPAIQSGPLAANSATAVVAPAPTTGLAPSGTESSLNTVAPLRSKTFTLNDTYGFDITSESANWGVAPGCDSCSLWLGDNKLNGSNTQVSILSDGQALDAATCFSATAYSSELSGNAMREGTIFCIHENWSGDHYAGARIVGLTRGPGEQVASIKLEAFVWS